MSRITHEEKVKLAFERFSTPAASMLFPDGEEQANIVITSVGLLFDLDFMMLDDEDYFKILAIFKDFLIQKLLLKIDNEAILKSLLSKHSWLLKTTKDAVRIFTFFDLHAKKTSFCIRTDSDILSVDMFSLILFPNHQYTDDNKDAHLENLDDEEFGLVRNKPVYTVGIPGSRGYLASLVTENGEPITWERLGSTSVDGVNGMVDIYITYLPNGEEYKKIYINMYGADISRKAPRGFKFK